MRSLGQWDIVYSWGVLHHTGAMWDALGNVADLVRTGGLLFISIYNDQGGKSRRWRKAKALYNKGVLGKWLISGVCIPYFIFVGLVVDIIRRQNPLLRYRAYKTSRAGAPRHRRTSPP